MNGKRVRNDRAVKIDGKKLRLRNNLVTGTDQNILRLRRSLKYFHIAKSRFLHIIHERFHLNSWHY